MGYESLKQTTCGFQDIDPDFVVKAAFQAPMIMIVLRTMLGFTPPEWAYLTTQRTGVEVTQGFVRSLDRRIRMSPNSSLKRTRVMEERINALVVTACQLFNAPAPEVEPDKIHLSASVGVESPTEVPMSALAERVHLPFS